MIFKKKVNFPYPVLFNDSNSYNNCTFDLDVTLNSDTRQYIIGLDYDLECEFITNLLKNNKAKLYLIIQSNDSKFFEIKYECNQFAIEKNKLSFSKRTQIQMMIRSTEDILFNNNNELVGMYDEFKNELIVPQNSILGFSNVVTFDGSTRDSVELFEKRVDPELKSEIKIEVNDVFIEIIYKKEDTQFIGMDKSLNNLYIYMGLQKALYAFIDNNKINHDDEEISIDEVDIDNCSELDGKLLTLMRNKMISSLNKGNIDEVISLISDGIIEKYTNSIKRCLNDGN